MADGRGEPSLPALPICKPSQRRPFPSREARLLQNHGARFLLFSLTALRPPPAHPPLPKGLHGLGAQVSYSLAIPVESRAPGEQGQEVIGMCGGQAAFLPTICSYLA